MVSDTLRVEIVNHLMVE